MSNTIEWLDNLNNDELKSLTIELIQDITLSSENEIEFKDEEYLRLNRNSEFANYTIRKYYKLSQGK